MSQSAQGLNLALSRRGGRQSFERPSSASNSAEAWLEMREQLKGLPSVSPA
ncbi:hypothetical protein NOR53_3147 [gamma proteobacterium NOR5-3]|nr:hypothetical protein NOR53_3147 [gamma proteobacterium NOR5-3]